MAAKLHKDQLVVCTNDTNQPVLRAGRAYEVDCIYAEDFKGEQFVYLKGISDPMAFSSLRFTPAMEDTNG